MRVLCMPKGEFFDKKLLAPSCWPLAKAEYYTVRKVGYANLGPSLPVAPLVQDDGLRRGEIPPRQAKNLARRGPRFCAAQL
jgi:hypothetical protein